MKRSGVPTRIDITPAMRERGAIALMAEEAQGNLTNCYGEVSKQRAERFAQACLEAALDLRYDE